MHISENAQRYIDQEHRYGAHNYHPLEVVLSRGEGVYVWDVDGKRYYDYLSAYSAVNQGHCHPKIVAALKDQADKICLTSRAFYNDCLGPYEEFVHHYFGYDKLLPMNSGAEAVETALKLARRWSYRVKKVKENESLIVVCDGNFHGRTISIVSMSSDPDSFLDYGPFTPGFIHIPYNNVAAVEEAFAQYGDRIAAMIAEPIQGEAGVMVPDDGYLRSCFDICHRHNALFIADEVQTGLCRTGKLLCSMHEGIRPDVVVLGKALSGGTLPVSAVLADDPIMLTIGPGEHGSTFGGFPLAARVAVAALEVLRDEHMAEHAQEMGELFRGLLGEIHSPFISLIRGKGLLNAVVINRLNGKEAWDVCEEMAANGLLAKPTHRDIIRLAPPLVITPEQIRESVEIIAKSLRALE